MRVSCTSTSVGIPKRTSFHSVPKEYNVLHEVSLSFLRHLYTYLSGYLVRFLSPSHPFIHHRFPKGSAVCSSPGCHLPPAWWEPRSSSVPPLLPPWSGGLCGRKPDDPDEYCCVLGPLSLPSQCPQERQHQQQVFDIFFSIYIFKILDIIWQSSNSVSQMYFSTKFYQ